VRDHPPALYLALAACALLAAFGAACGDDSTPSTVAKVTVSGSPTAAGDLHAAEIVPKLDDIGFKLISQGKPNASTNFQDVALAQYQDSSTPPMTSRVEISVLPDVATATTHFGILSEALRNPPPGLFGGDTTQQDTAAPGPGDQSKSFVTATPDDHGNFVWSDSYRFGRTFVIVYTISNDQGKALATRKAIAEHIQKNTN
jgi:hypothetical protein